MRECCSRESNRFSEHILGFPPRLLLPRGSLDGSFHIYIFLQMQRFGHTLLSCLAQERLTSELSLVFISLFFASIIFLLGVNCLFTPYIISVVNTCVSTPYIISVVNTFCVFTPSIITLDNTSCLRLNDQSGLHLLCVYALHYQFGYDSCLFTPYIISFINTFCLFPPYIINVVKASLFTPYIVSLVNTSCLRPTLSVWLTLLVCLCFTLSTLFKLALKNIHRTYITQIHKRDMYFNNSCIPSSTHLSPNVLVTLCSRNK